MKNSLYSLLFFFSLTIFSSCSKDNDTQTCPESEIISMKINGELRQFQIIGWGIDLENDNSGYTLTLQIFSGVFSPQQDSYDITLKLPYKKTGTNIMEEFHYFRVQNGSSSEGDFVQGELQSKVTVNKNTCFSATFSGRAIIDGNEVTITEGIINHVYSDPFD
ncbi:hypothetical protein ACSVH2_10105 [Flavobacterium sp. RSB2_4_14]|uniref:hypothetical protein n=1 Tax=Flavobacterium sp. RSB2_4_14 TaxID=3447665 RepID=UPI003F36AE0B